MNALLIPFTIIVFVAIYEFRNYLLIKNSNFLYEMDGINFYKHKSIHDDHNAIAVPSIFFKNSIIILGDIDDAIIKHEEGHLRQKKKIYIFLILFATIFALVFSFNPLLLPFLFVIFKLFFMHLEREADMYTYYIYNIKYSTECKRPKRKIERLMAWLVDNHAPDWIRMSDEYYDRRKNLIYLFIKDVLL